MAAVFPCQPLRAYAMFIPIPYFIPYNVDVAMERLPIANWILIGVTCFMSIGIILTEPEKPLSPDIRQILEKKEKLTPAEKEKLRRARLALAPPLALQPEKPA